jgi:hypothetical protein
MFVRFLIDPQFVKLSLNENVKKGHEAPVKLHQLCLLVAQCLGSPCVL